MNEENFSDVFYSNRELVYDSQDGVLTPAFMRYVDTPHHMQLRFRKCNFPTNTNVSSSGIANLLYAGSLCCARVCVCVVGWGWGGIGRSSSKI